MSRPARLALVAVLVLLLAALVFVPALRCGLGRALPFRVPGCRAALSPVVVETTLPPEAAPVYERPKPPLASAPPGGRDAERPVVAPGGDELIPPAPPVPGYDPGAVVVTGGEEPDTLIIDTPSASSGPGLFPEFFPRPPVTIRPASVGGVDAPARVVLQPRPLLSFRLAPIVGGEVEVGSGRPAAFVAVSPVRVWGFRLDVGASVSPDSSGDWREPRVKPQLGASVEPLDRLRVRVAVDRERRASVGIGYRLR